MNPAEGNPGINHLAQAIQVRIRQNKDAMGHDEKGIHCLLVLGEGGRDGILVDSEGYDYCRLAAYIPEARTIVEATPELLITRNAPASESEKSPSPAMNF